MKQLLPLILLIALPGLLLAQSKKVKIHAYRQAVLPGVRAITIDESGTTKEVPNKIPPRNFIYIEYPRNVKSMDPRHVWINGKLFRVKSMPVQLPVLIQSSMLPNKAPDTLVRQTQNVVLQLETTNEEAAFTPSSGARKKMKTHQIVLHTIENGRDCYYYLDTIKNLDPVALQ